MLFVKPNLSTNMYIQLVDLLDFDDYPGLQPMRSWANIYAQDCSTSQNKMLSKDLFSKYSLYVNM